MSERIYNFAAGPAVLPEPVLKQAQQDIWNIGGSGIGVMEHSHRGKLFDTVAKEAVANCRKVGKIPEDYAVLFLQGGASTQFYMVPANYLPDGGTADYLSTGSWSKKAIKEAKFYGNVHVAGSSEDENFNYIPTRDRIAYSSGPAYVHFTSNNTIFGTEWRTEPEVPAGSFLVCDASSDIFSRPIDVDGYGVIYAGAQKNLGPSGVTLVIIRKDLLERRVRELPTMQKYSTHAEKDSMYNTPPCFGIYIMNEVFKWILGCGGLEALAERNRAKAQVLYDVLDGSSFYKPTARTDSRSMMNVTFRGPDEDLEKKFVEEAQAAGFSGLKGHRSVGGMRASIYNAFPPRGCDELARFMKDFEARNG